MTTIKIKWDMPGPEEPGFLGRRRELLQIPVEDTEQLYTFLSQFIEEPTDHDEQWEALDDLSLAEFGRIGYLILGTSLGAVTDPKGGSSETP